VHPLITFSDCPNDRDILFVPGGQGQAPVSGDEEVPAFLAARGAQARYVTTVCRGNEALIVRVAGLLRRYRPATRWSSRRILPVFGAKNVNDPTVND
jgi:cyclohexyl-isocyanide hydratase